MESMPPPFLLFLLLLLITAVLHRSSAASHFPNAALPTKSGYLTVNSSTGSAIFYTYYEAQNAPNNNNSLSKTPILIWLQGGPGCSSMIGNFYELGPWLVTQDHDFSLQSNAGSWNRKFGLLFLDNPIGVGFSVAATSGEIPRNQYGVAKHLFIAIKKFIRLDASFKDRIIFITGESYAGKYLPSLGYYILNKNKNLAEGSRVNLGGVAIGNGLTDPITQVVTHGVNAYNLGLINEREKALLEKLGSDAVGFIKSGNWSEATDARFRVLDTLQNMTGLATLYDFRRLTPYQDGVVAKFLNIVEVKKALGVDQGREFVLCSDVVAEALNEDVMKSVRSKVEFLVENTKVLLYQGQCDLRDGVVSTMAWMKKMKWEGAKEFPEAKREVWKVDGKLAGYVQKWGRLSHVVVMNAGHLVPTDQPGNSQVMIEDWVLDKGLFGSGESEIHTSFKGSI